MNIHWLEDADFQKAVGQLRLGLNDALSPFNELGHHIYIPGAIEEIVELAIDFSKRCRGDKDHPISLKSKRNPRER